MWVGESICGFLKKNCLGFCQFRPPTQSLLVFAARSYRDLSSWHWNPGLDGLVWGWHTLLSRYPSQIFIHHLWVWGHPVPCVCPSYQSGWMCFFKFHSCQTSIQLDFWWFWVMVVLYFSCNFYVVVWRGEPCLLTSPSWSEVSHVLIALFVFLVLSCMSALYILEITPLSDVSLANMFSHMVSSLSFWWWLLSHGEAF